MVNAEESKLYYPWIAHLRRFNAVSRDDDDDDDEDSDDDGDEDDEIMYSIELTPCVGAIISKR